MTTDEIMALADEYSDTTPGTEDERKARAALRAAIEEALRKR